MKTTYKILLCGLGLLVIVVIWVFLDRAVAQSGVAALRADLVTKHGQPPLQPERDSEIFTASFAFSSTVDVSALWEDFDKLPQLMRMMPSGNARVAWQEGDLHTSRATNAWPDIQTSLSSVATEIRLLVDAVDETSGMTEADRSAVLQQGQIAYAWLGAAMDVELQAQDPNAALGYLKTMLLHANRTNLNWMWGQGDIGAYGAVWEYLQQTNLNEAHLGELASIVSDYRGTADWDKRFHTFASMMSSWFYLVRKEPEQFVTAPIHTGSTAIGSWSDFLVTLPNDPKSAFAWLMTKPKQWKYRWRDTFRDEHWTLTELKIDWDASKLGLETGAMTNALERARRQRKAHGTPGAELALSQMSVTTTPSGVTALPDHAHMLTKLIAEETRYRLMATAIALHRYRLREGGFPDALDKLVPDFLSAPPVDMLDGNPLRYRRRKEGGFILYSIGCYDGDDGGNGHLKFPSSPVVPSFGGTASDWSARRDWIWPDVATRAEVEADNRSIKGGGGGMHSTVITGTSP